MIAASLGRLPYKTSATIEAALLEVSGDTALAAVLGAARGYESFYGPAAPVPGSQAVTRLKELARFTGRGRGVAPHEPIASPGCVASSSVH